MQKEDKARVVAELTETLRSADTLIVADYRGLTMPQIDDLRGKLLEHGAKFTVVKNTLTRRAAKDAGADALLTLIEARIDQLGGEGAAPEPATEPEPEPQPEAAPEPEAEAAPEPEAEAAPAAEEPNETETQEEETDGGS